MTYKAFLLSKKNAFDSGTDWYTLINDEYPHHYQKYLKSLNSLNSMRNSKNNNYSNNNYSNNNKLQPKHSGCKSTKYFPKSGPNAGVEQHLTTGWRLSKGELISVRAVTTAKSKLSDKGWFGSIAVSMTNTKTGQSSFHWGTMMASTGKVVVQDVSMVMNPKAKNGGYCGTFINS